MIESIFQTILEGYLTDSKNLKDLGKRLLISYAILVLISLFFKNSLIFIAIITTIYIMIFAVSYLYHRHKKPNRLKEKIEIKDDFDSSDEEIRELFEGSV